MKNKELLEELEGYRKKYLNEDKQASKKILDKYDEKVLVYGSTPYSTFEAINKIIDYKPKRFIVIGCSIGWMNFYFNELNPDIKTIGIDIHQYRIDFGNDLITKHNLKNIELVLESFEDFEFKDGDLIWESNLMFEYDLNEECNKKIDESLENFKILSYRNIFYLNDNDNVKKTKVKLPVSWSDEQNFYIYEKTK